MTHNDFYYIGEVGIGTPPIEVRIFVDTGGGQIWTQCESCVNCYDQDSPCYDSEASSTYQRLPCEHPFCSGAPFTLIDPRTNRVNAYTALIGALQRHYDSYGLARRVFPDNDQLCIDDRPGIYEHPTITYHFQGADSTVDCRFVHTEFESSQITYFCINVFTGNGVSIIGATDQQNMRIIYDNNINSLQFFPEECAHDSA
ncbi:hypothetical protein Ddye_027946 [Dipteronia dyeriana]|uniref:Peptidase A1 domain-containing protein n=1 Tax=Dipteronia dyeriana TaxID=168575 RepID=A0AAD9TQ98_9ROSI|nr:hypothetical protein Ddye_027946 [Dipteronia dyeriana]